MSEPNRQPSGPSDEFLREAERGSTNLLVELVRFLRENKKWWLIPVVLSLVVIGALVLLGGTAVAPFIYTLW